MKRYDPILCMIVEDETSKVCDESYPAYFVSYVSGYAGNGVNRTEREYFRTEQEANKRANELKSKNIIGIKTGKIPNFYHTKDASNKYVEKAKELIKLNKGRLEIISALREMGLTPSDVSKYYGQAKNELGVYDSSPVKDEQKVIKSKNGYTLGINNGKLVLAFTYKGETLNNPHMWLGEASNESNYSKAIKMFEEFAKIKHNDSLDKAIRNCENK